MSEGDPQKPQFLQCCLICNTSVPASEGAASRCLDGVDCRRLLATHICPAARDELATVEAVCAPCLAALQQWNAARHTAQRLHETMAARYRAARQRRSASVLSLHLDRLVVQIPYGAFLANARGVQDQPWPELVQHVAAAVLESAGIARPPRTDPAPPNTKTVGCQTAPSPSAAGTAAEVAAGAEVEAESAARAGQPRPAAVRRPRGRLSRSGSLQGRPAEQPALLGCLRGWEGITNVQPSAPARPAAGAQKRVGFEGLKEQAARARDMEETLSILSVADTASLLDRTETLSVFSDTADLSTFADDNWTSLDLASGKEPDGSTQVAKERQSEGTPSVSFAEPSTGNRRSTRRAVDKGEDLLREFAETMSNISEGVVLEDLEGYFEEIDRPCPGGAKPAPASEPPVAAAATATAASTTTAAATAAATAATAAQCPVCQKVFRHRRYLRPHLRLHDGSLFRCEHCDAPFLLYYKLQLHLRRRHGVSLRPGRSAAARHAPAQRRDAADKLTCADCGRRFSHLTTLRQHERVHRGGGYPCAHCAKVFPSKSDLSRHADSHRAEKLYKCEDCGRAFQVSSSLARHRTLHTDRAAHCDLCGKRFDRKDTMLKHRDTHKASNEHACGLCGKLYKQRRILMKHVKLIHGGPGEHVCHICQKPFRTNYDLVLHSRRVHVKAEPESRSDVVPEPAMAPAAEPT